MSNLNAGQFRYLGKEVEPDERKRLALSAAMPNSIEGLRYRVFKNAQGQILLDPVKSVPAYEAWIYENPKILRSILKGVEDVEAGRTYTIDLPEDDD